jgi:hypothetical protein
MLSCTTHTRGRVTLFLFCAFLFMGLGCTQHQALREPDPDTIPSGHALLWLAVPLDYSAPQADLVLQLSDSLAFQLQEQAINEILVPVGVHSLLLPHVTQSKSNERLKRVFEEQVLYRMTLLEDPGTPGGPEYRIVPATGAAFETLAQEGKLPVVRSARDY